jgi:hypothetical protein
MAFVASQLFHFLPFWVRIRRGQQFAAPGTANPAVGEVGSTYVIARMMHRVLVENWEVEKAVEETHKKVAEIYARYAEG